MNNDGFMGQKGMEKLTSFDEVRRAAASMELSRTEAFTFLKPAITDIGTAIYMERKLAMEKHSIHCPAEHFSW